MRCAGKKLDDRDSVVTRTFLQWERGLGCDLLMLTAGDLLLMGSTLLWGGLLLLDGSTVVGGSAVVYIGSFAL